MIRTHKPRGHQWTHASPFQQTEGFRDIHFEDCTAPTTKIYCQGEDANLSSAERKARKKRIESLAEDFLNGTPLQILSARPCPDDLRNAISKDKLGTEDLELAWEADRGSKGKMWEDVEDDWTILKRLSHSRPRRDASPAANDESNGAQEEQATASFGRIATARALPLAVRPSEEALRMAAALRQRHLEKLQNQVEVQNSPRADCEQTAGNTTEESPARQYHNRTSNDWLSRRTSHMERPDIDDQSLDELRLSRIETPSMHPRLPKQPTRSSPRVARNSRGRTSVGSRTIQETITPQSQAQRKQAHTPTIEAFSPSLHDHDVQGADMPDPAHALDAPQLDPDIEMPHPAEMFHPVPLVSMSTDKAHFDDSPRVYIADRDQQDGRTPFMFRKRGSKAGTDEQPTRARRSLRVQLAKGSNTGPGRKPGLNEDAGTMSSPLRATAASGQSPPLQPQRRASEPPTSLPDAEMMSSEDQVINEPIMTDTWPGTQALLYQAQQNIFDSPEKMTTTADQGQGELDTPKQSAVRKPLKQLSQEPMPSTQMMIAAFEGFSTVKKPRPALKDSPLPTPTMMKGGRSSGGTGSPAPSTKDRKSILASTRAERRSSSLRHSIVSLASPMNEASFGSPGLGNKTSSTTELATPQPAEAVQPNVPDNNTTIFSTDASLPTNPLAFRDAGPPSPSFVSPPGPDVSYQAAQQFDVMLTESQLDRTIDELATDLLDLGEMEGVASQV